MKTKEPTAIAVKAEASNGSISAENLISQAIANKTPVESLEKLLAMRTQLKQEWAREEFNRAMADFQSNCPVIKKTKAGGQTRAGQVAYYYAPLESIVEQTKNLIKDNGFSYAVQTQTLEGKVKVTCIVKHVAGHSESSDVEVPVSQGTNVMSASQITAAALTFAKRYAFCNAFGILTGDDDNDAAKPNEAPVVAQNAPGHTITPKVEEKPKVSDSAKIKHLFKLLKIDLLEPMEQARKVRELTKLTFMEDNYPEIVARLEVIYKENEHNQKNN